MGDHKMEETEIKKSLYKSLCLSLLVPVIVVLGGCSGGERPSEPKQPTKTSRARDRKLGDMGITQVSRAVSKEYDATIPKVTVAIDEEAQYGGLAIKVDRWDPEPTSTIGCKIRCLAQSPVEVDRITWQVKYPSGYNSSLYEVLFSSPKVVSPGETIRTDLGGNPQGYMAELKVTLYSPEKQPIGPFLIVLKQSEK